MCGDEKQLRPIVVAEGGQYAVNEFRHQTGFSLFERLCRHGFPVNHLIECHLHNLSFIPESLEQ